MTNLREQMAPLLKEFQSATGRGNLLTANTALIKMVDLLITHIERQAVHTYTSLPNTWAAAAPAAAGIPFQTTFHTIGNPVNLSNTPPLQDWENFTATTTGDAHKAAESMVSSPFESDQEKEPEIMEKRKPGRPKRK